MTRLKATLTALFFLVIFTGFIGANCARNIGILRAWHGKIPLKTFATTSVVKTNSASVVYFLMDKKENETQKDPCAHLVSPVSAFKPPYRVITHRELTFLADQSRPIYAVIHNYRI